MNAMTATEITYALSPSAFCSMQEAQDLTNSLEENLHDQATGAPSIRPELVEMFSELVNNAAEHGMSPDGAQVHVRYLPHRKGHAFDVVIADSGPGIRATLSANPALPQQDSDSQAISLAVQELVSGTSVPTRGIGLWMTLTEMSKPGRQLRIQSGSGLLTLQGNPGPELQPALQEIRHRQGTVVRLTIPA